jgi:transposase-like protein
MSMLKKNFKNLIELTEYFPTDQSCREYLEKMRWNGTPICPHCDNNTSYKFQDGKYYKCKACQKKFTVLIGSIFEDTKISLKKWFIAIYIFTSHKKGISSIQLGKDIGVTQKSAWHMLHRIRYAFGNQEPEILEGDIVEVDETYIGGKRRGGKRGRGSENKTAVIGLVERNGRVITAPVPNVKAKTLLPIVREKVAKDTRIMTDDLLSYRNLGFEYDHQTIAHSKKEYVNGEVHTNTIEGYWSHLKRGIFGIYHQVSEKHLQRYCTEFSFRYNTRKGGEVERFDGVLNQSNGRLMYQTLIAKNTTEKGQ